MLGDLPRGKSQTALAWGLHHRPHQSAKRDKNGDNDLNEGVRGFGCLHPTRLHPVQSRQESSLQIYRSHLTCIICRSPPGQHNRASFTRFYYTEHNTTNYTRPSITLRPPLAHGFLSVSSFPFSP